MVDLCDDRGEVALEAELDVAYGGSLGMVQLCSVEELQDPVDLLDDLHVVGGYLGQEIVLGEVVVVDYNLYTVRLTLFLGR